MTPTSIRLASRARSTALRAVLAAALTTATLIAAVAPAHAAGRADASAPRQFAVSYADLDLQTEDGALALYQRIAMATRQVCPDDHSRDLRRLRALHACRAEAMDRAISGVGNERLAAIHAARTQRGSVA